MTGQVILIRNPNVFHIPDFQQLVDEAFAGDSFPGPSIMEREIRNLILDPLGLVLVKPWTTIAILTLPRGAFIDVPQMVHFYNRGTLQDKNEVLSSAVDILGEQGYNRVLALNQSGKDDKVWARALTPKGWTAKHKASLYEFEGPS